MRIALINPFPRFRNAEREYIERFVGVAAEQGHEAERITPDGRRMLADGQVTEEVVDSTAFDFALALHHATAKQLDIFTYGVLWVPLRDDLPQYGENMRRILSWDDRLSSDSALINGYVANAAWGIGLADPLNPLVASITCQRTDLAPRQRKAPRLFYAGTNWDTGQNTTGGRGQIRHEALLRALDRTGWADFFGPRYDPSKSRTGWEGFDSYRGDIPFDGRSTLEKIHDAGVSLALTSRRHRRDAVASVRVFEACAAGAVAITDQHPFFQREFGDSLLYVDSDAPAEVLTAQVLAHLQAIEQDPDAALARARAAQDIFHHRFTLDAFVERLCKRHAARQAALRKPLRRRSECGVVIVADGARGAGFGLAALHADLARQADIDIDLAVVGDPADAAVADAARPEGAIRSAVLTPAPSPSGGRRRHGVLAELAVAELDSGLLCLLAPGDRLTRRALADRAQTLESQRLDAVACPRPHPAGAGQDRRVDFDYAVPPEHFAWPFVMAEWTSTLLFRRDLLTRFAAPLAAWDGDEAAAIVDAARRGAGFRVAPVIGLLPSEQGTAGRRGPARRTTRLTPAPERARPGHFAPADAEPTVVALDRDPSVTAVRVAQALAGISRGEVRLGPAVPGGVALGPGHAGAWDGETLILRREALGDYPLTALAIAGRAAPLVLDAVLRRHGPVAGTPFATALVTLDVWEQRLVDDLSRPQAAPLTMRKGWIGYAAAWANMPHRREQAPIMLARRMWGGALRLAASMRSPK